DGAFVLKMLNEKFDIGLSDLELEEEAAKLGADCPFFIQNKPLYAQGIGTDLSAVSLDLSDKFLVLIKPAVNIATAEAYKGVTPCAAEEDRSEERRVGKECGSRWWWCHGREETAEQEEEMI